MPTAPVAAAMPVAVAVTGTPESGGCKFGGFPSRIFTARDFKASSGPSCVSPEYTMRSAIAPTLSASSKHRIVAWGIPKAFTGSPGIEQLSIRILGSSHFLSSSALEAGSDVPFALGVGALRIQGLLVTSGVR